MSGEPAERKNAEPGGQARTRIEVTGSPTPEELAVAVAVLTSTSTAAEEPARAPASAWNDKASLLRRLPRPGPDAWRLGG